jgi:predicted transcriptional regulator
LLAAVRRAEEQYRKVCLEAGNANIMVYQVLRDEGPLHFYELILRSRLSRASVHRALLVLRALGLVVKNEKTDQWSTVEFKRTPVGICL